MADDFKNAVIMRFDVMDLLACGGPDSDEYEICGFGISTLGETAGVVTEEKNYIHQKSSTTVIKGYNRVFPVTMDMNLTKVGTEIRKITELGKTGYDAERYFIRVNLFEPIVGKTNVFFARKFRVTVAMDSTSGDGVSIMTSSGNFGVVDDMIIGNWDTISKSFSPSDDPTVETQTGPLMI